MAPLEDQETRLTNVIEWLRIAKENLPAINDGTVAANRIAQASALLDHMYRIALAVLEQAVSQTAAEPGSRAA